MGWGGWWDVAAGPRLASDAGDSGVAISFPQPSGKL
jgi:hypothetical protein